MKKANNYGYGKIYIFIIVMSNNTPEALNKHKGIMTKTEKKCIEKGKWKKIKKVSKKYLPYDQYRGLSEEEKIKKEITLETGIRM